MADFAPGDHVAYVVTDDSVHSDTWYCGTVLRVHKNNHTDVLLMTEVTMTVDTAILTKVKTFHVNQQVPPAA
jgi:hypothetical protein